MRRKEGDHDVKLGLSIWCDKMVGSQRKRVKPEPISTDRTHEIYSKFVSLWLRTQVFMNLF